MANLKPDLVLEILGMSERGVVEDEDVREGSNDEVKYKTEEPRGTVRKIRGFTARHERRNKPSN